jgi:hypothetical protein
MKKYFKSDFSWKLNFGTKHFNEYEIAIGISKWFSMFIHSCVLHNKNSASDIMWKFLYPLKISPTSYHVFENTNLNASRELVWPEEFAHAHWKKRVIWFWFLTITIATTTDEGRSFVKRYINATQDAINQLMKYGYVNKVLPRKNGITYVKPPISK